MAATIELAAAERAAGRLSPDQLDAAVAAMEADGFVLLVNAIDVATIDRLGEKMRADMAEVARSRPIGELATNESLTPPVNHPWLFEEICFNPFALQVPRLHAPACPPSLPGLPQRHPCPRRRAALAGGPRRTGRNGEAALGPQVLEGLLGAGFYWDVYSQNSIQPNETRPQGLHPDQNPLFPSEELHPHPQTASMCVVNIPLMDYTAENGATAVCKPHQINTLPARGAGSGAAESVVLDREVVWAGRLLRVLRCFETRSNNLASRARLTSRDARFRLLRVDAGGAARGGRSRGSDGGAAGVVGHPGHAAAARRQAQPHLVRRSHR